MKGKVALVTGGSSRIGRATALAFAKEGAQVVIASRSKTKATKAVRAIEKLGSEVSWIQADVSDTTQVQNMVRQTVARFGRLDYAFNNGGSGGKGGLTAEMEEHDWDVNRLPVNTFFPLVNVLGGQGIGVRLEYFGDESICFLDCNLHQLRSQNQESSPGF